MVLPFKNDTSAITKKIARNDISKNRTKYLFSLITIALATTLLMSFAMFESGYEVTKDRAVQGQPQIIFSNLSAEQVELLRSDENIESVETNEIKRSGYEVHVTIIDATKMTQYGFSTTVNNIATKYDINHVTKNNLFMDSLPDGGLLNQKNIIFLGVALFIVIVSIMVIFNIFYLSVANQVQQFGQFRTIGMTKKQVKQIINTERKMLCKLAIPIGLLIGAFIGYLLQPKGFDLKYAIAWGIIIYLIITLAVKISLNKPIKVASSISPIGSSKYMLGFDDYYAQHKLKRKLSAWGMATISVATKRKKIIVSIISLGLSGLLFTLAATYMVSINAKAIVEREIYQYGQFVIDTTGEHSQKATQIRRLIDNIENIPYVNEVKQIIETDIKWVAKNNSGKDTLSIINAKDIFDIQPFVLSSDLNYQELVYSNQVIAVEGAEDIFVGDRVGFIFGDGVKATYTVGAVVDDDIYYNTALYGGSFIIPKELIPKNSGHFATSNRLVVSANENELTTIENELNSLLSISNSFTMTTITTAISKRKTTIKQVSLSIISVTLLLLFFSIMTFASTIITSIATRKREYALLQSIGMTCKQVRTMEIYESLLIVISSLTITFVLGIFLGHVMIKVLESVGVFYLRYSFPLTLFIVYCLSIILIISIITYFAFNSMQKTSLVDRLRTVD